MGCAGAKATLPCGPEEANVRAHPHVKCVRGRGLEYYTLKQSFAIVRHGDRLDHTADWMHFPDRERWPNDTPLTPTGHEHAREVGETLKKSRIPFGLIVASPYFRCAQTASRIAQVLELPIHFDLDIGEVFDGVSMRGVVPGRPQHRSPLDLELQLKPDFPDVVWIRDDATQAIKVEGKLQDYPEDFDAARMRYCYKVKKLVQTAAKELMSIVIVTHGDALAAVVGLLREDREIEDVPYTAYAIASREVKVMDRGANTLLCEEGVYTNPLDWKLTMSPGFTTSTIHGHLKLVEAHQRHEEELKQMNAKGAEIKTNYMLNDKQAKSYMDALHHLGAHDVDTQKLMSKVNTSNHMGKVNTTRVQCSPHSKDTE